MILSNILTIEFLIRAYLVKTKSQESSVPKDIFKMKQGQTVPENYFTNLTKFGALVDIYNKTVKDKKEKIPDPGRLKILRLAIAHGRVSTSDPEENMTIYHFTKSKKKDMVAINYAETMTEEWFKKNIHFTEIVAKQLESVVNSL